VYYGRYGNSQMLTGFRDSLHCVLPGKRELREREKEGQKISVEWPWLSDPVSSYSQQVKR
jgi:hypothetical protein